MTSSRSLLILVAVLATGPVLSEARATPLDADTCNKMMIEQGALETAGVEQTMAKGPEWAKANLPPEKIAQVRRFIELEEMILFRCRSRQRVVLPPDPEDEKEKAPGKDQATVTDEAKDGEEKGTPGKDASDKQETVLSKTAPPKADASAPAPTAKADAKKQKAQGAHGAQGAKSASKAGSKTAGEPKGEAKAPSKTQAKTGTASKSQSKTAKKQDTPGAKVQAKAAPQTPKKEARTASPKTPPKAKAEPTPKDETPPSVNPFGSPFDDPPK